MCRRYRQSLSVLSRAQRTGWWECRAPFVHQARKRVEKIYDNLTRVFDLATELGIPPHEAAEKVALERIAMVRPIADVYTGRARTSWQHKPIALQNNG